MKKITILLFLAISTSTLSQQIFLEAGKMSSNFEFENSSGNLLENLNPVTKNYISAGYAHRFFTDGLHINLGVSHNSYGSIGSDNALGNYFEYNVDYLGINLGFDYNIYTLYDFTFFLKTTASYEFLVQGTQTLNNQVFDLDGVEEFDDAGFFFRGGLGVSYPMTGHANVYLQYMYGQSLDLEDTTPNSNEKLQISMHMIGVGISVDLPQKDNTEEVETEIETEE
jgi:Outer membrane protein beta-barrel domain